MTDHLSPLKYAVASNKAVYSREHSRIFFALLLKHAFDSATEGIYQRIRSDSRLLNLARLKAKTKVHEALNRDMLFAEDAAIATQPQQELQLPMNRFSQACKDFGPIISLKKTNVMGQDMLSPPAITINNFELDSIHQFTCLGSTLTDDFYLDTEIDKRVEKAATTPARLTSHVWSNPSWPWRQRWLVRHGPHMPDRTKGSIPST